MLDAIIVGAGPAGLSAALYCARYNLKVTLFSELIGGAITESAEIENYPGTLKASGMEMMQQWKQHAEHFGAKFIMARVTDIERKGKSFKVKTGSAATDIVSKSILLATGTSQKELGVPGEKEFAGRGVSKCPTCDGMFFTGKAVAVVGGGDSALRGCQVLLQYARKVLLIHRRDKFRGEPILIDRIAKDPKVELVLNRTIKQIKGDRTVKEILLDDGRSIMIDGVFIEVGNLPKVELAEKLGVTIEEGLIRVGPDQSTSIEGVYAAGDVTTGSNNFRQVLTAAAEGAIAAHSMFEYCKDAHSEGIYVTKG